MSNNHNNNMSDEDALKFAIMMSQMNQSQTKVDPKLQGNVGMQSVLKKEHKFQDGRIIQVRKGDMTKEKVDAIVNAANNKLIHSGKNKQLFFLINII